MSTDPAEIRAEIERTRANLSADVDALADRTNPKNVARRAVDDVKDSALGLKDRVMGSAVDAKDRVMGSAADAKDRVIGSAGDAKDSAGQTLSNVGDTISGAPQQAKQRAQGNPLAAGLIAFGGGWLLGSLIPASQRERQAASQVKDTVQDNIGPLQQKATEAVKDVAENLREPAQQAVQSVKDTATEGVQNVKEEGTSAVSDVKDQAQDSKDAVQETRNS